MWGQCCLPALWRSHLRGLQGILQEDGAEERQVRLPGRQELPGGQEEEKPLPVLPLPEVPGRGDGEGGGEDGQSEGKKGEASYETKEQPGSPTSTSSRPDHGSRQSACRVHAQAGESGLLTGIDAVGDVLARVSPAPLGEVQYAPAQPNHG